MERPRRDGTPVVLQEIPEDSMVVILGQKTAARTLTASEAPLSRSLRDYARKSPLGSRAPVRAPVRRAATDLLDATPPVRIF